ncbi:ATP-binding cassette subfamily B protein [Herbihabitans rhizosphaerae]|uniref:ATP-binding cassette subfamily B protein n=1 Tax=Herbihabitans rhizosphaerae TaxID=1872711 RepID=A0A4Q7KSS6_9PSEU|nr:ABC transporter ATP-binding protein [Herbihabitans rhizosphaerae]RZS38841.1 ATP-binding cassette subfamily B protein [Herbihabitans rhizosphaerae]
MSTFRATARRAGSWLPLLGLSALAGTLSLLALPVVLGNTVDAIVSNADSLRWLALAAALIGVGVAADLIDAYAGAACVAGTTAWLRDRLVGHVLAVGPHGGRRLDTGDLVSRVSGNAAEAAQAGPSVVAVVAAVLPPVGSLVLLALIDLWLAVAFLAGLVLVAVILRVFTRQTAEVVSAYLRAQGRIAGRLSESLAGVRTIAAAGTVELEERRVLEHLPELHRQGVRSWRVLSRSSAQAAVVGPLVLVAVLATGGVALSAGRISPGELFAASQYAVIGAGLGGLTGMFGRLARSKAGAARVGEVLDLDPVRHGGRTLPEGTGRLEFRGVTVRAGDVPLLDGVDLVVPGGSTVAVVGPSGAGKSVLTAVAARLCDPDEGTVLLDGVPLDELCHEALRTAVGCAFDRPVLVGATVADAIGSRWSPEQVEAAARATYSHDFVSRLPHRYATPLTDAPMSGGELQRLGLARAWRAERLLVLDDATSSLDTVTEMRIGQTLIGDGGRTRLVVTHRASTAARADLVVWLAGGRVRAVGTHEQLRDEPDYREVFG